VRQRWWGATGRKVPEIAVEGDPAVPLDEALVVDDLSELHRLQHAHAQGQPVVVRVNSQDALLAALARPEVAAVVVPETKQELLELDLTKLTYG
jgi:citrate lyase beta subunit